MVKEGGKLFVNCLSWSVIGPTDLGGSIYKLTAVLSFVASFVTNLIFLGNL